MQRIKDPGAIEQRLLELAHTTDVKLTAAAVAYFAPCSIEDAPPVLDDLTARDQLRMEIQDDGSIVYELPGRQKISEPPRAAHAPELHRSVALVPARTRTPRSASPLLAAVLSMWIPGSGHLYAGRAVAAVLWFLAVGMGYVLIIPGLVLHLFCIASAASAARRLDESRWPLLLSA